MNDIELSDDALPVEEGWPRSLTDFEWGFQRIGAVRNAIQEIRAQGNAAKAAVDARVDDIVGKYERSIAYIEAAMMRRADEWKNDILIGTKKSRDILHGRIGWRKKGGKLIVTDKEALVEWLKSQDDTTLYRVKVEPEMKAIQALAATTGILPPGTDLDPERDEVYLEPKPLPTLELTPLPKVLT